MRVHLLSASVLFLVAFGVRGWLQQGLVLGDDPQEFAVLLHILTNGPLLTDQLHLRFAGWIFNHLAFLLLGVSEFAFLLPTWVLTSTFPIMAYVLLVRWGYGPLRAFLGGLLVATAPFEVMLGGLRANDSYLELALAAALVSIVLLEERPVWQGIAVAVCLWFAFYVKLFVVYALPALGLYYLIGRRWRAAFAFTVASMVIHGLTCVYWWTQLGTFFPFFSKYAANYPVPADALGELFLKYPRLMLVGSFEFPTTLWGATCYVVLALLLVKVVATFVRSLPPSLRFDRADAMLMTFYLSFFALLEFFPNGFQLDAYYSVPRIFRYLAPLSFPIALHAAKLVLDVTRVPVGSIAPGVVAAGVVAPLLALNVVQAVDATGPGRVYRRALLDVLRDVRAMKPPMLVAESTIASYFRDLHLDPDTQSTEVVILYTEHQAPDYEHWLREHQDAMPDGTLLVSGLANFVHYGAHMDGYRLEWFAQPLSPQWKLVREYGMLTYLPRPEPARLWRLDRPRTNVAQPVEHDQPEDLSSLEGVGDVATLFAGGMARYEKGDYPGARIYFRKIMRDSPAQAEDAALFYAASFFREANWKRARHEFKRLIHRYPNSRWVPPAYWHIAVCEQNMGHIPRARRGFEQIIERFPQDPSTVTLAKRDLDHLRRRRGGLLAEWWRSL